MEFVGRKKELKELESIYGSNKPELILVYGRRRLGKTTLIKKSLPKNSLYFLLTKEKPLLNLKNFKEGLKKINPLLADVNADSWEEYFRKTHEFIPENFVIVLDEFPYLVSQDKSLKSQFQKIYDEYLKPRNIKLILCGSSKSIMEDLQSYESPLYGRRTKSVKLKPFSLKESFQFLKKGTGELKLKIHLITGGIPYYLEQFIDVENEKNLEEKLLSEMSIFNDEAYFLLKEDFKEISNYFTILKYIARGKESFTEISDVSLVEKSSLSKYLQNLERMGYVKNEKSFFSKQNSKKTKYVLIDNFLYVWFNVIYKYLNNEKHDLNTVFGKLFEQETRNIYSKHYEEVKPYFKKEVEIDFLARKNNNILCVECKFTSKVNDSVLKSLKNKIKELPSGYDYKAKVISLNDLELLLKLT